MDSSSDESPHRSFSAPSSQEPEESLRWVFDWRPIGPRGWGPEGARMPQYKGRTCLWKVLFPRQTHRMRKGQRSVFMLGDNGLMSYHRFDHAMSVESGRGIQHLMRRARTGDEIVVRAMPEGDVVATTLISAEEVEGGRYNLYVQFRYPSGRFITAVAERGCTELLRSRLMERLRRFPDSASCVGHAFCSLEVPYPKRKGLK